MQTKRAIDDRDPQKQRDRKALEPAAKEFRKSIESDNLSDLFDDAWFSDPQVGFTPGSEFGIKAEYQAIAEDKFFANNGNAELAKNAAMAEMKRLYGVTRIAGKAVVMKHPPESYWPQNIPADFIGSIFVGDPFQYAHVQLEKDVAEHDPNYLPGSIALVTTPETDQMVKRREMPGYSVMWQDKNGNYQTLAGQLWKPDTTQVDKFNAAREQRRKQERESSARQTDDFVRSDPSLDIDGPALLPQPTKPATVMKVTPSATTIPSPSKVDEGTGESLDTTPTPWGAM